MLMGDNRSEQNSEWSTMLTFFGNEVHLKYRGFVCCDFSALQLYVSVFCFVTGRGWIVEHSFQVVVTNA